MLSKVTSSPSSPAPVGPAQLCCDRFDPDCESPPPYPKSSAMNDSKWSVIISAVRALPSPCQYRTTVRGSSLCGTSGSSATCPKFVHVDASIKAACVTSSIVKVTYAIDLVGCFLTPSTYWRWPLGELGELQPPPIIAPLPIMAPLGGRIGPPPAYDPAAICSKNCAIAGSGMSPWRQKTTRVSGSFLWGVTGSMGTPPMCRCGGGFIKTACA
mmetsp:Transcript_29773/g.80520  ORF Transcript_29773/g.80520 Transcript_29773/m.80520 type:complete len:213 (+) Transcript_29773:1379-2017(+)